MNPQVLETAPFWGKKVTKYFLINFPLFVFLTELLRDGEVPPARAAHQTRQEVSALFRQSTIFVERRLLVVKVHLRRRHPRNQGGGRYQKGNVRSGG